MPPQSTATGRRRRSPRTHRAALGRRIDDRIEPVNAASRRASSQGAGTCLRDGLGDHAHAQPAATAALNHL
jgi:hypothetical protein